MKPYVCHRPNCCCPMCDAEAAAIMRMNSDQRAAFLTMTQRRLASGGSKRRAFRSGTNPSRRKATIDNPYGLASPKAPAPGRKLLDAWAEARSTNLDAKTLATFEPPTPYALKTAGAR